MLRIPETQGRDLALGLPAVIDTRNGTIAGRVSRIDPAAQNGTVTVDVSLEGALPKGARPDLSVDGTIEIDRLANVLHVGRPADGSSETTVGLFRIEAEAARRCAPRCGSGRASANAIEVIEGLNEGDE